MLERDVQRAVIKILEARGAYVIKTIACTKAGIPDVIACYKGKFIAIEVKTDKTIARVSDLQKYNLGKISDAGGISLVICQKDMQILQDTLDSIG